MPNTQANSKADYPAFREAAKWTGNRTLFPRVKSLGQLTTGPIADLDEATLEQRLEELWVTGGLYFFGGVSDLMTSEVANNRVSDFFRGRSVSACAIPKL